MNSLNKIVQSMYGSRRLEETASLADMDTQTYIGIATGDSEEGSVSVWLTDDVTQSDNGIWDGSTWVPADESDTSVVLPTTQSVHKGDRVLVSMFGGNTIATPVVTGVIGGGDSIRQDVDVAQTSATSAEEVANAVNQHFWEDDNGVHVTQVTQDEWNAVTPHGTNCGPNALLNSLGLLFRNGLNNLASFTASAVEFFTSGVSVASFGSTLARIGVESGYHVEVNNSGLKVTDGTHVPLDLSVVADAGILDVDEVNVTDSVVAGGIGQFEGGILAGTTLNSNYISHVKWGTGNAVTNGNGITTFNPSMGVKPLTVVVVMQHNAETEAIAKIAVPIIWSIDSATQVQVRWKRTDNNAWLTNNRVCWTWLAIA